VGLSVKLSPVKGGKLENSEVATRIISKLDICAVPMDVREFNRKEYREVFPQGTVKTPIGEVKIGKNQFEKMAEKDNGGRRSLIGAMRQTLADPVVIVPEEKDGRKAYLFIKSFKNMENSRKPDFIMSVVVTIDNAKIAVSTYKRKRREVLNKIKRAGVIAYEKDYGASQTNGIKPAT
jgi:predicted AlkP superfamily pyrophosphatase or phosphodiesterase